MMTKRTRDSGYETSSRERATLSRDHLGLLGAGLLMMVAGWGGLFLLVTTTLPLVGQRWLFLVLLHIAVVGTLIPFVRYVNVRLTPWSRPLPPTGVIVRQSVWFGLFAVASAWLAMPRVLSAPIMFFLALAFIVVEVFLRTRELAALRAAEAA